jgi:tetratricopeptide (TPR) repeat protein
LARLRMPPTVEALLAARLERLGENERAVLERAAIAGKVFYPDAVADLSGPSVRENLDETLRSLVEGGLIQPAPSDFAGRAAYRFRHILFRDAAYDSLPKQLRAELHQRFAGWLERVAAGRGIEVEELAGYHLEACHRLRQELGLPGDPVVAARAAARLGHAGRRAAANGDLAAAENLLTRTLALLPAGDPERAGLMVALGEVLTDLAEFVRAELVLGEALMASEDLVLAAQVSLARTYLRLAVDTEGASDHALTAATDAIAVFRERGHHLGLAKAWVLISEVHLMRCRMSSRYEAMEQAREHAVECGDEAIEARCVWGMLGSLAQGPAHAQEVLRFGGEALAWARARGRRSMEAAALAHLARAHAHQARLDQARAMVAQARAIWEDLGLAVQAASSSQVASLIEVLAGDLPAAVAELHRAIDMLEQVGERNYAVTAAAQLARVRIIQGEELEAERLAAQAREAGASDDVMVQVLWRGVQARILAAGGETVEAKRLALEAVELADGTDFPDLRGDALVDLAEVLLLAGEQEAAEGRLSQAHAIHEAKGNLLASEATAARLRQIQACMTSGATTAEAGKSVP